MRLVRRAKRQLVLVVAFALAALGGTIGTMVGGLLSSDSLAWVPSLCVLLFGVGLLLSVLAVLRLRAARALRQLPLDDDLLEYMLANRERVPAEDVGEEAADLADDVAASFFALAGGEGGSGAGSGAGSGTDSLSPG